MTYSEDGPERDCTKEVSSRIKTSECLITFRPDEGVSEDDNSKCCKLPSWYLPEWKKLMSLSWPLTLSYLMQYATLLMATAFCGRLGTDVIAGVALAITLINISCLATTQGLATACDTLFSQTFGSSNKRLMGVYLQRSVLILFLSSAVVSVVLLNAETFFLAVGENAVVSRIAGEYVLLYLPGAVAMSVYAVLVRYILTQNRVRALIVIAAVGDGVDALMHYLLVYQADLGYRGSALALACCHISLALSTLVYILVFKAYSTTWAGWTIDALFDWGDFMKLALPGCVFVTFEYLLYEVSVILAALLSDVDVAAMTIIFQTAGISYNIYLGLSVGVAVRVGQNLGSGEALAAKRSGYAGLSIGLPLGVCFTVLFIGLAGYLPRIFTNDIAVIDKVAFVLPLGPGAFQMMNVIRVLCNGILRGVGRQAWGVYCSVLGYLIVGLPIGIPLMMMTSHGIAGFFYGILCGMVVDASCNLACVVKIKWIAEVEKARSHTEIVVGGTGANENEKTKLLSKQYPEKLEYGSVDVKQVEKKRPSTSAICCRRLAAILVVLLVLAAGLLLRFFVHLDGMPFDDCMIWDTCNTTTPFPVPLNVTKDRLFGIFR